jgi:hypothetical protein
MGALTQYWPAMVVPAKCQRSIQMLAFYSKVGAQLKVTKKLAVYISATWRHIKKW